MSIVSKPQPQSAFTSQSLQIASGSMITSSLVLLENSWGWDAQPVVSGSVSGTIYAQISDDAGNPTNNYNNTQTAITNWTTIQSLLMTASVNTASMGNFVGRLFDIQAPYKWLQFTYSSSGAVGGTLNMNVNKKG